MNDSRAPEEPRMEGVPLPDREPFPSLLARVRAARGSRADEDWAGRVITALILRHEATVDATVGAIEEVIPVLADADPDLAAHGPSSPQEHEPRLTAVQLLGEPDDFAREQAEAWHEAGSAAFEDGPLLTPRTFLIAVPGLAAGTSLLLLLSQLLTEGLQITMSPGLLAMPLVLALNLCLVIALYERIKPLLPFAAAAAITAGSVVGLAIGSALLFSIMQTPRFTAGTGWLLPLALGYAAIAGALIQLTSRRADGRDDPDDPAGSPAASMTAVVSRTPSGSTSTTADQSLSAARDHEWERRFRTAARRRSDLPERQIEDALAEAREHAREAWSGLDEQFGSPEDFARALPGQPSTPLRRKAMVQLGASLAVLIVLIVQFAQSGWTWSMPVFLMALWLVACVLTLLGSVRELRALS